MKTNPQPNQVLVFISPKSFVVKKDYILIFLENGVVIRKHVNFFKKLMNIDFRPKERPQTT